MPDRGFYEVSGLAWSGGGAISRVEISTDGGRRWEDAEIQGTAHPMSHTRFSYQWTWDGQETELLSRSTDDTGQVQPTRAQIAEFFGERVDESRFVCGVWTIPSSRGGLPVMGGCTMRLLRFLALFIFPLGVLRWRSPPRMVWEAPQAKKKPDPGNRH
ncbi:MAG: hypothetical protein Ct9H300mP25_11110 [Acidobacteriota bacterium]|nr:MAG: hypothetical protein Ct9H300mP25_11110 [Acidobacteriota bacterium]